MRTTFGDLSVELIEWVVIHLELNDICSLRLTCRNLEIKASQGHFASYFRRKNVRLTPVDLQKLIGVTDGGPPGRYLQDCTLTGIARFRVSRWQHIKVKKDHEDETLHLLVRAFENIRKHSWLGHLTSLKLTVDVVPVPTRGPPANDEFRCWKTVWATAASTFKIVMAALDQSQLTLRGNLDVFSDVQGCSLSCDVLHTTIADVPFSTRVLGSLRKLTLSCSQPMDGSSLDYSSFSHEAAKENQFRYSKATCDSLLWLLEIMPELESLDLHWYILGGLTKDSSVSLPPHTKRLNTEGLPERRLKDCTLRGVHTSHADLLHFIETVRPSVLLLINTILGKNDEYGEVFQYLTSSNCPVSAYHLNDIREQHRLVHYRNVLGSSPFPYLGAAGGPCKLTRSTGESKDPIQYYVLNERPLGSPSTHNFRQVKTREYGWPHENRYDFIKLNANVGGMLKPYQNCYTTAETVFQSSTSGQWRPRLQQSDVSLLFDSVLMKRLLS